MERYRSCFPHLPLPPLYWDNRVDNVEQAKKDIGRETSVLLNGRLFPLGTGRDFVAFMAHLVDVVAVHLLSLSTSTLRQRQAVVQPWLCIATCGGERVDLQPALLHVVPLPSPRMPRAVQTPGGGKDNTLDRKHALIQAGTQWAISSGVGAKAVHTVYGDATPRADDGSAGGMTDTDELMIPCLSACTWRGRGLSGALVVVWVPCVGHVTNAVTGLCVLTVAGAVVEDILVTASRTVTGGDSYAQVRLVSSDCRVFWECVLCLSCSATP